MSAWLPEAAAFAVEPPSDLLHGLALRPPAAGWDGSRYRGSALDSVRLDDTRAQAGVVAAVRREHFAGVVAVTPQHARQALACMAPVWRGDGPSPREDRAGRADGNPDDDPEYQWRPADTASGARRGLESRGPPDAVAAAGRGGNARAGAARAGGADGLAHPGGARGRLAAGRGRGRAAGAPARSAGCGRRRGAAVRGRGPAGLRGLPAGDGGHPGAARRGPGRGPALRSARPWAVRPSLARLLARPGRAQASGHATVQGYRPVLAPAASPRCCTRTSMN
ncbi:hypothetical protein WJ972_09145 [Achromobacter insuavis]